MKIFAGIVVVVASLMFLIRVICIGIKKEARINPVLLRTGSKIYFFDGELRCARVVWNFREDERLLVRTIGRDKERLTIDYSQVLEKRR